MKKHVYALLLLIVGLTTSRAQSILYQEVFLSSLNTCTAVNGSNGNWIFSNSCSQSSSAGHSASGHALFQGSGCQFGNGGNTVSGDMMTPQVLLPALGGTLQFNYFLITECGSPNSGCFYDQLTVGVSTNNGISYTNILGSSGSAPLGLVHTGSWLQVNYNLSAYAGQNVKFRFNFNSIDGIGNNYDGVYVDDITIIGACDILLNATSGGNTVIPILCAGNSLTLTTNAISNYSWNTGASSSSLVVSPVVNTVYTLTATSPQNCVASKTIAVTVNPTVPSLSLVTAGVFSAGVCPNNTVMFTASGANSYTWTGGITNGVAFNPVGSGSYSLSASNACGTSTAVVTLSVHPTPTVSASISQPSVCTGNTVATVANGAVMYSWSHGQPNGSPFFPSATTIYTVIGTNSLNCTSMAMVGVTVVNTPILAPVASPTIICLGSSGTISAQGATNYTWAPVNTFTGSNSGTIVITPTSTATYTLTKANSNCVDVKTIIVVVNNPPGITAMASPSTVCAGSTTTLSAGGAPNFSWTPSPFALTGASVVVSPVSNIIYTCTGNDNTCTSTYFVPVVVNPIPTLQTTNSSTAICVGQSMTLTALGGINYTWNPGGQNINPIVVSPSSATFFTLIGDNSFSCTSTIQVPVIVYNNPSFNAFATRTLVCIGGPSTLNINNAANTYTYSWSSGAFTQSTIVNPQVTTVYTVTGVEQTTGLGCSTVKTVTVQTYTPVTAINGPTAVCIGTCITLASAQANSYTWTLNGNLLSNAPSIVVCPTVNTTYLLGTISTTNSSPAVSCVGANSITVLANHLPTITATSPRTLVCKSDATILNSGGGVSYNWLFTGSTQSLIVYPIAPTKYTVEGTDANGCKNTATIQINVSTCQGLAELSAEVVGFSLYPNPSHGEFSISAKQTMNLELINELGQLVMEIKLDVVNNYSAKVQGLAQGVYFLKAENLKTHKVLIE